MINTQTFPLRLVIIKTMKNGSLFDYQESASPVDKFREVKSKVIKIKDFEVEERNLLELFDGFDEAKIVTFSSSLKMLSELSDKGYKKIELIISNPSDFRDHSLLTLEKIDEVVRSELINLIPVLRNGLDCEVRFLSKSHSKFYLLRGANKKRVILGSLNFSHVAWSGRQREEIFYSDDENLCSFYEKQFDNLFNQASVVVDKDKLMKEVEKREKAKQVILAKNLVVNPANPESREIIKDFTEASRVVIAKNAVMNIIPQINKRKVEESIKNYQSNFDRIYQSFKTLSSVSSVKDFENGIGNVFNSDFKFSIEYRNGKWQMCGINMSIPQPTREDAVKNLELLKRIFDSLKEHNATDETIYNVSEAILFVFAGSYLWSLRERDEIVHEDVPIFGILAGTSKSGKSLTLSILANLTVGPDEAVNFVRQYTRKHNDWNLSVGNSEANLLEAYFEGRLNVVSGVYPLLVNEVNPSHLNKNKKLYQVIKEKTNKKLERQHSVAVLSVNLSMTMPEEIGRRVFFLEYTRPVREHKALEEKLKPLVNGLNPNLFYYFLNRINPYEVEVRMQDVLKPVREFVKSLDRDFPVSEHYLGDVEPKGEKELRNVFARENVKPEPLPSNRSVLCYRIEKSKFRYPPPAKVVEEDVGDYYYLNKKEVDRIVTFQNKTRIWNRVLDLFKI